MNIPNALSIFRMFLVPIFVWVFFRDTPNAMFWAAGIYALAGVTDVLDGIIARKFNMITKLGKILDPLADKLMTITVFICISIRGIIPWWVLLLLFSKDILLVLGGIRLYREVSAVFAANIFGKATTVFLVIGGIIIMLFNEFIPALYRNIYIYIAVAMSFIAFFSYLYQYIHFKKTRDLSKL
ncbi:MAG: CDP-diacylglycerol--glycerol-3-phosphate 3-phosphatidyltransferase [Clostridia bacterium]